MTDAAPTASEPGWSTLAVEIDQGVAWVTLNRPAKRNAMNPTLNAEMHEVLDALEFDDRCGVLVLTGAGDSFTAGMDLKEYFRETEAKGPRAVRQSQRDAYGWWRRLRWFQKPTIAMVNGWCFGGGFAPLFACDLAVAAETATFGVSEVNWGIIPGGNVTKILVELMSARGRHVLHPDRRDLRRAKGGRDEGGQRGGRGRAAQGARARDRRHPAGEEPRPPSRRPRTPSAGSPR